MSKLILIGITGIVIVIAFFVTYPPIEPNLLFNPPDPWALPQEPIHGKIICITPGQGAPCILKVDNEYIIFRTYVYQRWRKS